MLSSLGVRSPSEFFEGTVFNNREKRRDSQMKTLVVALAGLLLAAPAASVFAVEVTPDMNDCQKNCVAQYGPAVDANAAPSREYDPGKRARVLAAVDQLNTCLQGCADSVAPAPAPPAARGGKR